MITSNFNEFVRYHCLVFMLISSKLTSAKTQLCFWSRFNSRNCVITIIRFFLPPFCACH